MNVIDLSHTISPSVPVYPGTEPPAFVQATTIERDGFAEMKMSMYTHTATHMDGPSHVLTTGKSLDQFAASHFVGKAVVIDVSDIATGSIPVERLVAFHDALAQSDFLLLKTSWSRYWGQPAYFKGFPSLSLESARWLAQLPLKGVGIDAISIDPVGEDSLPAHHALLGAGMVIVENLTNLDAIKARQFLFVCLPLKISGADGSPVRAVAIEGDPVPHVQP